MTVVDNHTCSSSVVIKLGAICVAVDVEIDRFDIFVIFLCWDVHSKFRVEVISCRHTVLILFAQWNGVKDSVKDLRVAGEVTSGIDHSIRIQCPFALSLRVPFSASSSIQLSISMISLILLRAFPGEDGRAPEIKMLAKRCTLLRRVMFFLVCRPFNQITAPYERLGL